MNLLLQEFVIEAQPNFPQFERYNIPPTADVPVVRQNDGVRQLKLMRWGLLPSWTKDPMAMPPLFNARADTVATKPSFRSAYKKRRCIVPASGFYEWRKEGKERWPLYFQRTDERPLAFVGLWEAWGDVESCTIITTEANELMAPIHNRMPVILARNDYDVWLDPDATDLGYLLATCPADELKCHPVDRIVNKVGNDGPECIVPLNSE